MKKSLLLTTFVIALVGFIVSCQKESAPEVAVPALAQQYDPLPDGVTVLSNGETQGEVVDRDRPLGSCCLSTFSYFQGNSSTVNAVYVLAIPLNAKFNYTVKRLSDGLTWSSTLSSIAPTPCNYVNNLVLSFPMSSYVASHFNNCEDEYTITVTLYSPGSFGQYTPCSSSTSTPQYITTGVICF